MARKGINKAIENDWQLFENRRLFSDIEYSQNRTCIFVSHKKEDADKAREITDYIIDCGIDVFFDENDEILSNPETNTDPVQVTNAINRALNRSTHMICILSEKTKISWWVPYEIGYVSNNQAFSNNDIGILLIKNISQLPEYLFLAENITTTEDLDEFLKNSSNTKTLLLERLKSFNEIINHPLKSILN
jgi:hypothetical protein